MNFAYDIERFHRLSDHMEKTIRELNGPIAIFGAGGFIGFNLFLSLSLYRDDIICVTHNPNLSWRLQFFPPQKHQVGFCDITSRLSIEKFVKTCQPSTVFNLAAYGAYSWQQYPPLIYHTNFLSLETMLHYLQESKITCFVNMGSSSEYGTNAFRPKEDDELRPNSHYSVSKIAACYILRYYGKILRMPVTHLRLYSIYGPWEDPNRFIPKLVLEGLKGGYPKLVHPDTSRDFVYVNDCIEAILKAAKNINRLKGETLNISSNQKTTIGSIALTIQKLCKIDSVPEFETMANRDWDVDNWFGNSQKAKEQIEWQSQISVEDGILKTIQWHEHVLYEKNILTRYDIKQAKRIISFVVYCSSESEKVGSILNGINEQMARTYMMYEIIFCLDGEDQPLQKQLRDLSENHSNIIVIEHAQKIGKNRCLLDGLETSVGEAAVLMQANDEDLPEYIGDFISKWIDGADIVYGTYRCEAGRFSGMVKQMLYRALGKNSHLWLSTRVSDYTLLSRSVINRILKVSEMDPPIRLSRAFPGYSSTSILFHHGQEKNRVQNLLRNLSLLKEGLFLLSNKPMAFVGYLGVFAIAFAIVYLLFSVAIKMISPEIPHGITSILLLVTFFGGLNVFVLSIIGQYTIKILGEVKKGKITSKRYFIHGRFIFSNDDEIQSYVEERKKIFANRMDAKKDDPKEAYSATI